MIYELRVYQPVPGQMPKLLARFETSFFPSGKVTAFVRSLLDDPRRGIQQ